MEMYGRSPGPEGPLPDTETGLEESMWQLGIRGGELTPVYPERPGEPDCAYYLRTGTCGYGDRCRYNHPRDRSGAAAGAARTGSIEYPERVGQPLCQYFLKTGTCKFGPTCKYHHPRQGGGSVQPVSLNHYGYPLRPGEKECPYYLRTGQCKFGATCKFHHPQPAFASAPSPAPAFYPTVQSASAPSPQQYTAMASWQVPRPSVVPASYMQGPYGPMLLSHGVVPVPSWSPYPPPVSPVLSPSGQQTVQSGSVYGLQSQLSPSASAYTGTLQPVSSSSGLSSSTQKENIFPERPGQPECQYYMRTGDCKFGPTCRYHHPPGWNAPKSNCVLSPMGLPLRPGAPICAFYMQHAICKFGPTCKFNHPMEMLSYSPSASSLTDMPVAPYPVGLTGGILAPSSSSDLRPDFNTNKDNFSVRMPLTESTSSGPMVSSFPRGAFVPHVLLSGQASTESSGSSSNMGHGDIPSSS